jgi:hypothetical protein
MHATDVLTSFISENNLDYNKPVGQGYDGAATLSGSRTGVQRRMGVQRRIRVHAAHALYIHYSCHSLQLASMQIAKSIRAVKMFSTMASLWKLFTIPRKKQKH